MRVPGRRDGSRPAGEVDRAGDAPPPAEGSAAREGTHAEQAGVPAGTYTRARSDGLSATLIQAALASGARSDAIALDAGGVYPEQQAQCFADYDEALREMRAGKVTPEHILTMALGTRTFAELHRAGPPPTAGAAGA